MMARRRHKGKPRPPKEEQAEYDYHLPVLLQESVEYLVGGKAPAGIFLDGTMGGGGHTAAIIERLEAEQREAVVFAFDADTNAHEHCTEKFNDVLSAPKKVRLNIVQANFNQARSMIEKAGHPALSGFLLDLGVSSRQLDSDSIGLSYRVNSKLNMSFSAANTRSAEEIVSSLEEEEIESILRRYGEEPFSRKIARRLAERRRATPLRTTFDVRDCVLEVVPPHLQTAALSRVFQALRIAVNDELNILQQTLLSLLPFLEPHGRAVVISYHSLEDRIVKQTFAEFAKSSVPDPDNPYSNHKRISPEGIVLTKKPIIPPDEEIARNFRARSAKLRVLERYSDT